MTAHNLFGQLSNPSEWDRMIRHASESIFFCPTSQSRWTAGAERNPCTNAMEMEKWLFSNVIKREWCDNASIGTYYEHEMQLNARAVCGAFASRHTRCFPKCTKTARPPMFCAKVLLFVQHAIRSRATCYTYRKAKVKCNSDFTTFIGTESLFHSAAILSAFIDTPRSLPSHAYSTRYWVSAQPTRSPIQSNSINSANPRLRAIRNVFYGRLFGRTMLETQWATRRNRLYWMHIWSGAVIVSLASGNCSLISV